MRNSKPLLVMVEIKVVFNGYQNMDNLEISNKRFNFSNVASKLVLLTIRTSDSSKLLSSVQSLWRFNPLFKNI